jgi:hypothetical protein
MRNKLSVAVVSFLLLCAVFTAGLFLGRQTAVVPAATPESDDLALKESLINHIREDALSGRAEEFALKVRRWEFFVEAIDRRPGGRSMIQGILLGWAKETAPLVRGRFWYEASPGQRPGSWTFRQVAWRSHLRAADPILWP